MTTLGLTDTDDDQQPRGRRFAMSTSTVVQIVIYVIAIAMAYSALDKRITVLESKYDRIAEDLQEIRADVKILIRRP